MGIERWELRWESLVWLFAVVFISYLHCISFFYLCVLVTQSYPTLCDPLDCSTPGSSVHGILQERILEWVAIPFSRGSSHPRG